MRGRVTTPCLNAPHHPPSLSVTLVYHASGRDAGCALGSVITAGLRARGDVWAVLSRPGPRFWAVLSRQRRLRRSGLQDFHVLKMGEAVGRAATEGSGTL